MNTQSLNSITFVITVVYTVTFANTIYLMTVNDASIAFSLSNMAWSTRQVICGIMCLIMTLRFFFGNNQYIADVMNDSTRTPWVKFYQFFFIAIQSILLLACSYSIREHVYFVYGITSLFATEVLWYFLTMIVDRKGVLPGNMEERRAFFYAEMTNLFFVLGVVIITWLFEEKNTYWLILVFTLFMINTIIDVRKNMKVYMS